MLIVRGENSEFIRRESGEHFRVLLGRHEKHGGTRHHTVAMVELDPGATSEPHLHKEREESYFVVNGAGFATIDSETATIKAGDLIYAKPGQKHSFTNKGDSPMRYLVITAPCWSPDDSFR
ncbi:MAG: cupin domain-containing protein [Oligoflexales bacterium]